MAWKGHGHWKHREGGQGRRQGRLGVQRGRRVSNWGLRRRCRKGGAGCRRAPRCEEADRAWAGAEVGRTPRSGRPGRGEAGTGSSCHRTRLRR